MNRTELENKISKLVAHQVSLSYEDVKLNSNFVHELGFDSLDVVETVMCLEDEFGIDIPDEDAERLVTVKLVVDYIEKVTAEE